MWIKRAFESLDRRETPDKVGFFEKSLFGRIVYHQRILYYPILVFIKSNKNFTIQNNNIHDVRKRSSMRHPWSLQIVSNIWIVVLLSRRWSIMERFELQKAISLFSSVLQKASERYYEIVSLALTPMDTRINFIQLKSSLFVLQACI